MPSGPCTREYIISFAANESKGLIVFSSRANNGYKYCPPVEIALMGAEGAVKIVFRKNYSEVSVKVS